jgi:hypothetical protein
MNEDWPTTPEKKQEAIDALYDVIRLRDPELTIEAFKALVKADESNIRRQLLAMKQQELDEQRKLRILEFLRSVGPDEVGRLASASGVSIGETEVG